MALQQQKVECVL